MHLQNFKGFSAYAENLGTVTKCSLTGAITIKVDTRSYCIKEIGSHSHANAILICKNLNSKLPIPKNQAEVDAFTKHYPDSIWLGLSDPGKTGIRENWKDVYTWKSTSFVKVRVIYVTQSITLHKLCLLKCSWTQSTHLNLYSISCTR